MKALEFMMIGFRKSLIGKKAYFNAKVFSVYALIFTYITALKNPIYASILDCLLQIKVDPIVNLALPPSPSCSSGVRYGSKKSLIILTSGATAGAAEEFVYIMKKLGRAMIVGETTAGATHPPQTFRVSETDIFLSIPTIHSDAAAGVAWEGTGITPHIPVSAEAALGTAKGILNKHIAGQK